MTNRQKAAILRRVARAIEKEWVRQGQPTNASYPLMSGCCFAARQPYPTETPQ